MFAPMIDRTSLLFFPGTRPELLSKAVASGAGRACVDLEDSVEPSKKAVARGAALELVASHAGPFELVVRINHPGTVEGRADLDGLRGLDPPEGAWSVMIPKAASREEVSRVRHGLGGSGGVPPVIPVVEGARGLANVEEIAATEGVSGLLFGALDLSVDLGCARDWEPLLHSRSRCVLGARLAGVELLDSPFFEIGDLEGLRAEAERARRLGFTGKAAIHPSQVPVIREAFAPTDDEVARARRIVEAAERESAGVFVVDGAMIDRPAVEAARRLLGRHYS